MHAAFTAVIPQVFSQPMGRARLVTESSQPRATTAVVRETRWPYGPPERRGGAVHRVSRRCGSAHSPRRSPHRSPGSKQVPVTVTQPVVSALGATSLHGPTQERILEPVLAEFTDLHCIVDTLALNLDSGSFLVIQFETACTREEIFLDRVGSTNKFVAPANISMPAMIVEVLPVCMHFCLLSFVFCLFVIVAFVRTFDLESSEVCWRPLSS